VMVLLVLVLLILNYPNLFASNLKTKLEEAS